MEYEPKVEQPKRDVSKFKYHIPYMIINAYRVELTNYHSNFEKKSFRWTAEIHYSQGKDKAKVYRPRKVENHIPPTLKASIDRYIEQVRPSFCSFNSFQKVFCMTEIQRKEQKLMGPYELLESIKEFITGSITSEETGGTVKLSNKLPAIPITILVGYYILGQITKEMGGIK